jgi:hypothetical protein
MPQLHCAVLAWTIEEVMCSLEITQSGLIGILRFYEFLRKDDNTSSSSNHTTSHLRRNTDSLAFPFRTRSTPNLTYRCLQMRATLVLF